MLNYPRPIDEQMTRIFMSAQKTMQEELFLAIKEGKSYRHIEQRLIDINEELKSKYATYTRVSTSEHYLDGTLRYGDESKKYLESVSWETTLSIAERTAISWEFIGKLWGVNPLVVEHLIVQGNAYAWQALDNSLKGILGTFSQSKIKGIFETIWKSEVLWKSGFETKKELISFFQTNGVWSMTDKAWRKRTLARYSDMLQRTETAKAKNLATLLRGKELWITRFKRIEHGDCCDICVPHRGEIINIKDWMPYLILHPNCRGYWKPLFDE